MLKRAQAQKSGLNGMLNDENWQAGERFFASGGMLCSMNTFHTS